MTEPQKGLPPLPSVPAKPWWRWLMWPFAILGVLAAIALIWLMVVVLDLGGGRRERPVIANAGEERRFTVGQIEPLNGTSLIAIEIAAVDTSGSISKGYGSDQRNLLLLDQSTGRSRRVLPDNSRRIQNLRYLSDGSSAAAGMEGAGDTARTTKPPQKPVRFVMFEMSDPAHPEKGLDLMVLAVSAGEPAAVLQGIDGVDHLEMLDDDHAAVIVRQKGQLRFKVLDLPARKVTEDHPIDIG